MLPRTYTPSTPTPHSDRMLLCRPRTDAGAGAFQALTALLTLVALTGCSALEPRPRSLDLEIPSAYQASASEGEATAPPLAGDWWRSFGVAELDAAVEEALAENRDLEAAAARLTQAEARARIAGANLLPQVSAGLNGARSRRNFIGLPIPGAGSQVLSSTATSLGVSLDISWEADLWGRLRAGKGAALSDVESVRWQWQGARLSLAGQVTKTWFAAAEARRQVELAEEVLASRRDTTAKVRRRYEAGLRPALDLRLALANEEGASAQLAVRGRLEEAARRQLEILLGRYPAGQLQPLVLPESPEPLEPGLPADLVVRRPDLQGLERQTVAAGLRVKEARGALFPQLRLTGSGGTASDQIQDLLDGDFRVWSLAAGLLQPIFQGGRLRAAVDLAEGSADEALARYAQGVLLAFGEVENALAGERWLREQLRALAAAAEQAEAAGKLAEQRYESGLGDYLEVLESQRGAFDARSRLLEAQRLVLTQRVDLLLALGGGVVKESSSTVARTLPGYEGPQGAEPQRHLARDRCSVGPPWPATPATDAINTAGLRPGTPSTAAHPEPGKEIDNV